MVTRDELLAMSVKEYCRHAGIKPVTPNVSRRFFLTEADRVALLAIPAGDRKAIDQFIAERTAAPTNHL